MASLSEIEKLEARFRENPEGRYFAPLADAYRKAGRLDDALMQVQHGLERHPDYLSAHIVLGRIYVDKKDDNSALAAFQSVLKLDPENIIALKSLAEISERMGNALDARRWLMRLLAVDAMNTEAEEDLARLGGAVAEEAAASGAVEAPAAASEMSFAELIPAEEAPTQRMPAIEEPVPEPMPEPPRAPPPEITESRTLEIESVEFVPPPEPVEAVASAADLVPFDDQLAWGAGERQSQAIRVEDIAAVHHDDAIAPAIDFMSVPPEDHIPATREHAVTVPPEVPPADLGVAARPGEEREAEGERTVSFAALVPPESEPSSSTVAEATTVAGTATEGLPIIMPEDVTPPEELTRPSSKMLQMGLPEPVAEPPAEEAQAEPMLTETMGDLYLKQGFKNEAADVYRRLLAQRPDDPVLKLKLEQLEAPRVLSAAALGSESVGVWLRRIARSSLATPAPVAPPETLSNGPTPMEAAFDQGEPESEPAGEAEASLPGQPAHPASSAFSLDQIFGAEGGGAPPAPPPPSASVPQVPKLGASFDEFFGAAQEAESVRPKPAEAPAAADDDLSAFNAWLHGLKR